MGAANNQQDFTMSPLVYSTDQGRHCPACKQAIKQCQCGNNQQSVASGDGIVRLRRETKGRKGNGVTLITGLPLVDNELKLMAKELKQRCGTGGSVKNGIIEIQGDQREILQQLLQDKGYHVKLSGS
jgi:translation initiation factor 1